MIDIAFLKLIIKITLCVMPGVTGIYLIAAGEDTKRAIRQRVCTVLFDSGAVFTYAGFRRFLIGVGVLLILVSLGISALFVVPALMSES